LFAIHIYRLSRRAVNGRRKISKRFIETTTIITSYAACARVVNCANGRLTRLLLTMRSYVRTYVLNTPYIPRTRFPKHTTRTKRADNDVYASYWKHEFRAPSKVDYNAQWYVLRGTVLLLSIVKTKQCVSSERTFDFKHSSRGKIRKWFICAICFLRPTLLRAQPSKHQMPARSTTFDFKLKCVLNKIVTGYVSRGATKKCSNLGRRYV